MSDWNWKEDKLKTIPPLNPHSRSNLLSSVRSVRLTLAMRNKSCNRTPVIKVQGLQVLNATRFVSK